MPNARVAEYSEECDAEKISNQHGIHRSESIVERVEIIFRQARTYKKSATKKKHIKEKLTKPFMPPTKECSIENCMTINRNS